MNRRRWHDYDDGFDEADLHDDEELHLEPIKRRPALWSVPRMRKHKPRLEDATHRQRVARVKAWGAPY